MITKPMLSGEAPTDLTTLRYPLAVSPKLDGFRAIVVDGVVLSRNLKPIRNAHVQNLFGRSEYEGYDGELIVGSPTSPTCFRDTSSGVTSFAGTPEAKFYVFDRVNMPGTVWRERIASVVEDGNVIKVPHFIVPSSLELIDCENTFLDEGYEGLMIRGIESPYKQGRSTTREGWLLKLKRFADSEALVIGMEEKMHNANEATVNALGHTERSSHQANLVPLNTMGALVVKDLTTGVEFNIGTGFDDSDRDWWWNQITTGIPGTLNNGGQVRTLRDQIIVKYKYFAVGVKDKPRFPTYLGIRSTDDL